MNRYKYRSGPELRDHGGEPWVADIERLTRANQNYRVAVWTGRDLQLTLMCIRVGGDIGLEMHAEVDQFLRVESGCGLVRMGNRRDNMLLQKRVDGAYAIIIPAGTWHNVINTGNVPLKLYSIYAPPQHAYGTVHPTPEQAEEEH